MNRRKRQLQACSNSRVHKEKQSKIENEPLINDLEQFPLGCIVWSKLSGCPWWPGMIIDGTLCNMDKNEPSERWIFWFGDHKISKVSLKLLLPFKEDFSNRFKQLKIKLYKKAVEEASKEYAAALGYIVNDWNEDKAIAWAEGGFPERMLPSGNKCTPGLRISENVKQKLQEIVNMRRKVTNAHKLSWINNNVDMKINQKNKESFQNNKLTVNDICLGCMVSRKECKNLENHPLFEGGICPDCFDHLKTTFYAYEATGEHLFCTICSRPSYEAFKCGDINCERTYCSHCIETFGNDSLHKTLPSEKSCILCTEGTNLTKLCRHADWRTNVLRMYSEPGNIEEYLEPNTTGRGLRVLSLFDGIGTGLYVLKALGLVVDKYYASEVNQDAVKVSQYNFNSAIQYVGDVRLINKKKLKEIGPIDLLIGGSPCNDLSFVNPKRKGLYDPEGTGVLFFEFFKIKKDLESLNRNCHLFWMFENVTAMASEFKDVISRFLESSPVVIDAKHFSAQDRARLYWGNIPGMRKTHFSNASPILQDTLLPGFNRIAAREKLRTVTTNNNCMKSGKRVSPVTMDGKEDVLWLTELEDVFGFPQHYTDVGDLSLTKRRKLLGKAWSVPVIKHILKPLRSFFKVDHPVEN